jgi:signal transduction histidine kinase
MTGNWIKIKLGLTSALVMLTFCFSEGQSAFNPDSLQEALKTNKEDSQKLEIYKTLAKGYLNQESYDSSILYCDSSIALASATGDKGIEADMVITKGNVLFYSQGPVPGIVQYKDGYHLYSSIKDSSGMARALNGMGVMYKKMGQYDSALNCYMQLVGIAEKKGYEQILGLGYVNLGILYQDLLEYENAHYFLDLSIPINEKYRPDLVAMAWMNKGLIHDDMDEVDSALIRYRQALTIYRMLGKKKILADLYNNFGNLYYHVPDLDSARHYYTLAKDIYEELGDWYTFCQVYNNLALVSMERGNNQEVIIMLDSCIVLARQTGNIELESLAFKNKHLAYRNLGQFELALDNHLLYDSIHEVIFNLEKEKLKADLETKYEVEKKQAQILALERDYLKKSKQNNIYLFTAIGIIALIIFILLYFRQRAAKDRIIAQQRIRQLEEEKKFLAAQALVEGQEEERKRIAQELHDGLGVLLSTTRMQFSAIGDTSPESKPLVERAAAMLEQATSDVRKISHNMMPGLLTKLGLYEALGDLFEKLTETHEIKVNTEIPEDLPRLPENKEIMLYRIIQELVNNTLKHAEAKHIECRIKQIENGIEIFCSDDGKGFDVEEKLESKSLGLKSIRSRMNFLNGVMDLESSPGEGTHYYLQVPC